MPVRAKDGHKTGADVHHPEPSAGVRPHRVGNTAIPTAISPGRYGLFGMLAKLLAYNLVSCPGGLICLIFAT